MSSSTRVWPRNGRLGGSNSVAPRRPESVPNLTGGVIFVGFAAYSLLKLSQTI